ncbi:MAG TPA: Uma2 family endonuclease [Ktedonobacteraceae bacterium]|nr:Uma2 family endonuclease [Ktedonobacteraceae bacterium]
MAQRHDYIPPSMHGLPRTEERFERMTQWHSYMPPSVHGIPMTEEGFERLISVESPYRYELIDEIAYNMTGSSPEHSAIASNIEDIFRAQLGKSGPCRAHHDQYVLIPDRPAVVPDVVVTCDLADWDEDKRLKPFKIQSPLIVVEVLSPSTEYYNRTEKFARYKRCPTLEVYILVSQDEPQVEVFRRANDWKRETFTQKQKIKLNQLDLELPLEAIYEGVLW